MRLLVCSVFLSMAMSEHLGPQMNIHDESPDRGVMEKFVSIGRDKIVNDDKGIIAPNLQDSVIRQGKLAERPHNMRNYDQPSQYSLCPPTCELRNDEAEFEAEQQENVSTSRIIRPIFLLSIDMSELGRKDGRLETVIDQCRTIDSEGCRILTVASRIQQPFYVDEPSWIEIHPDRGDTLLNVHKNDPFFVSRGKKIFRSLNNERKEHIDDRQEHDREFQNVRDLLRSIDLARSKVSLFNKGDQGGRIDGLSAMLNRRTRVDGRGNRSEAMISSRYIDALAHNFRRYNDPFIPSRDKETIVNIDSDGKSADENAYRVRRRRTLHKEETDTLRSRDVQTKTLRADYTDKLKTPRLNSKHSRHDSGGNRKSQETFLSGVNVASASVVAKNMIKNREIGMNKKLSRSQDRTSVSRKKRNACTVLSCKKKSMTEDDASDEKNIDDDRSIENVKKAGQDVRREKYPDILDMFDDLFIISRGKKDELEDKDYGVQRETAWNDKREPSKARRTLVDEFLTNYDPHYVTRSVKIVHWGIPEANWPTVHAEPSASDK